MRDVHWRERFTDHAVLDEFEASNAELWAYLQTEHTEDGGHSAITADSLAATGAVTAGGAGTFGSVVTAHDGDTDHEAALGVMAEDLLPAFAGEEGVWIGGADGFFLQARVAAAPGTSGKELRIWDLRDTNLSVARIVYDASNSRWLFGVETGGTLALGENSAGKRIAEINTSLLNATQINTDGGGVGQGEYQAIAHGSCTFTASSGTWTVASGDLSYLRVSKIGPNALHVRGAITLSSVSATPTELRLAISGYTFANNDALGCLIYTEDAFATQAEGQTLARASGDYIAFKKTGGAAWATTTDNTGIIFSVLAEID